MLAPRLDNAISALHRLRTQPQKSFDQASALMGEFLTEFPSQTKEYKQVADAQRLCHSYQTVLSSQQTDDLAFEIRTILQNVSADLKN